MPPTILRKIALASFALTILFGAALQAQTQDTKTPYPSMAPLDQYLIADANSEIALAPGTEPALWGADVPGSPVILTKDADSHFSLFLVPVTKWSDGTAAPPDN